MSSRSDGVGREPRSRRRQQKTRTKKMSGMTMTPKSRPRTRKRQAEEIESWKYRRVIEALNASGLSEMYKSKFQRHEMDDKCIQNCVDNPQQLDIYLSSVIPIVGHKINFLVEFRKTKESENENDRAEQEHQQQQEQQPSTSTSTSAAAATSRRIQQPNVYVNPNIMKVKMEEDYVPVKKEPEPEPTKSPAKNGETDTVMENSEAPSAPTPDLKNIQTDVTRIDAEFPGPSTANDNDNDKDKDNDNDKDLFEAASVSVSAPESSPPSVSVPPPVFVQSRESAPPPEFASASTSRSESPYTFVAWWDTLEKLQDEKDDVEKVGFQIITYLSLIYTHKFPVKKAVAFSGWKTPRVKLAKGFRLLQDKYKLIKIKNKVVHLNIESETACDEAAQDLWLQTLLHRTFLVIPLLGYMTNYCIHILDEDKMTRTETEEMFENFLLLAKTSGRDDYIINEIHPFFNFLFQLALRLLDAGRYEESLPLFRRVSLNREQEHGENNRTVLVAQSSMALILDNQGRSEEALSMYQHILPALESHCGPDDEGTVSAKYNTACIFKAQRKWDDALDLYREVYQSRKKTLGPNHIRTKAVSKIMNEVVARKIKSA